VCPGQLGTDLNLIKDWKFAQFIATVRTSIDPNGRELNKQMPWRPIGRMDDDELAAVYEYLSACQVLDSRQASALKRPLWS
jgi:hypothetical protein